MTDHDELVLRVVTIIVLGVIVFEAVAALTIAAVMTDRNLLPAETFTFGGAVLLGALGGVSWWQMRRRRWRVQVDRENGGHEQPA